METRAEYVGSNTPVGWHLPASGMEDGWDYDAMDTMTVSISDAPKADEILRAIACLGGTRPNARIKGNSPEKIAALVAQLRTS